MTPVRRSILICFVPRSGSTLLCGLLASTGALGWAWERYWAPDDDVSSAGDEEVRRRGTTPNGVFACKFQLRLWNALLERERLRAPGVADRLLLEGVFPHPLYVRLRRGDRVAQAVSLSRAMQTRLWSTTHEGSGEPRYDRAEIEGLLELIGWESDDWDGWLAGKGIEPHEVTYEQLPAEPREAVAGIARTAGVELRGTVELRPYPGWDRQADAPNEAWTSRFRAEVPA